MECPHCKSVNPSEANFCLKCATPLPTPGGRTLDGVGVIAAHASQVSVGVMESLAGSVGVLTPGSVLGGRYEILSLLGVGGMGAVYKARDREVDRLVALKVIRPDLARDPEILQRFKQELLLARQISHKGVIRIYDLGEADGIKFISMEYIDGKDLRTSLTERGKYPPEEASQVIVQVLEALDAAHSEGVVHRDLKPQNIMVDKQGRVTVMDFGIARSTEQQGLTQTGAIVGTPEYMSPEQAKGEEVNAQSDIFSLGIIFYELLTGKTPYRASSAVAMLVKRTQERAAPPVKLDPTIPKNINDVVVKCLEIDPQRRYQSAQEVVQGLGPRSGGHTPLKTLRLVGAVTPRWITPSVAAGIAVLLLIAGLLVYRLKRPSPPSAAHAPVSLLVADFSNYTGDPIFDDTLEPMVNVALEGASFINAYNRGAARKLAENLPHPTPKLDEQSARLVAVGQGISAVITGQISRRGNDYRVAVEALDARTGNTLGEGEISAASKDAVLLAIPKLIAPIRKALGDTTPESVQLEKAGGAFTTSSLEAVHQYGVGMEEQFAGNFAGAVQAFSKAVELDPSFARAYAGMAGQAANMGKLKDAEKYLKLAMEHVDRMTDRERYRIRGSYYLNMGDWQKCVDEYGGLVSQYPGDNIGYTNLAGCYSELRNAPKAVEEARQAVKIVPRGAVQRLNLAFFSSFSGDFQSGEREAKAALGMNPLSELGYLDLSEAQLGEGNTPQATESYQKLEKLSVLGASFAASGLGDLALYQGRFAEGVRILEQGAAADLAAKNPENAANKFATLSRAQLLRGQKVPATTAADQALAESQTVKIRFLAAWTFVETGDIAKAQKLASSLGAELQAEPQSYAKIIQGMVAEKHGDNRQAIAALTDANKLLDTWISRFELGRAYLQAGLFVEADSEFDRCLQRRGEAMELFMDNVPTYSYLPDVYYELGRVREGLKSPGFAESYRTYLSIRGQSGEDPLVPEIRGRIGH